MKDILRDITVKEAIIILTIVQKLDFNNWRKAQKIRTILESKNPITSKGFLEFRKAFLAFTEDGTKPTHCCICGEELEKGHMICPSCLVELRKKAGVEEKPKKASNKKDKIEEIKQDNVVKEEKKNSEKNKKKEKTTIERVTEKVPQKAAAVALEEEPSQQKSSFKKIFVIAACAVGLLVAIGIFIMSHNTKKLGDVYVADAFVNNYQQLLMESNSGLYLSEGSEIEAGIRGYTIEPTTDMLFVFSDAKGQFQGIGLQMQGRDEASKTRQLLLMGLTHFSLYDGMTTEESDRLTTQLLQQNGDMTYKKDHWTLTFSGPNTIYMILPESVQKKSIAKEQVNMPYMDGFELLGKDYESVKDILGDSTAVISDNTRYYEDKGLSLLYQADTGIITYVDIDGSGNTWNDYPVMGISCGMNRVEAAEILEAMGLQTQQNSDDWEYSLDIDGVKYTFAVSFIEDKVALVSVFVKNGD